MKRFLLAGLALAVIAAPAFAADMPRTTVKAAQPVQVQPYWTGFYVGGHAGYGWSKTDAVTDSLFGFSLSGGGDADDFQYGINAAALYQFSNNWVLGVAARYSFGDLGADSAVNLNGPAGCGFCGPIAGTNYSHKIEQIGTAGVVLGYAMGSFLPYASGGFAYAKGNSTVSGSAATPIVGAFSRSAKASHTGYYLGAGLKWSMAQNVTLGLDYQHIRLGDADYSYSVFGPVAIPAHTSVGPINRVMVDLELKF